MLKFQLFTMLRRPEPSADPFMALAIAFIASAAVCAGTAALFASL